MSREIPQQNPIPREGFGTSKMGEWAYEIVRRGAACGVIIDFNQKGDDGKPLKCGKKAIGTLDYDTPSTRDAELLPVCSDEHRSLAAKQISDEYERNNWTTPAFGRNGRGRS